jgi:iron uptake system component EfeO
MTGRSAHDPAAPKEQESSLSSRSRVIASFLVLGMAGACVANQPPGNAGARTETIAVESSATECKVASAEAPSGTISFSVRNTGTDVTEFYLLAEDGLRVISEIENVGPGLTRDLVVRVGPGSYVTACKPGMVGDGIRSAFTVKDSGVAIEPSGDVAQQLTEAETSYVAYVKDQAGSLIAGTKAFAEAYTAGDDALARELYPDVRVHWERIEPVAESFGDLDPLLDAREADLADGDTWSGWHYLEKDLWPPSPDANGGATYEPMTPAERLAATTDLVTWTERLVTQVNAEDFTFEAFQISNGAKELLDEVASGKVTGEEEIWSHTDLWDFQANVDGAWVAFEVLRDVAEAEDPELAATLVTRFDELNSLLAEHGSIEEGFSSYDELTTAEVQALAAAVDAVGEPLSRLTTTITGAK